MHWTFFFNGVTNNEDFINRKWAMMALLLLRWRLIGFRLLLQSCTFGWETYSELERLNLGLFGHYLPS